jgi:hypothetical protein
MKRNKITFIIAGVLIIVAAILVITNSYSTLKKDTSMFAVGDTAVITKIFIADKQNNQVTLVRRGQGMWMVDGKFKAQPAKMSSFLKTLKDLEVRAPVPINARNNVIKRLSVLAKKIEIYQIVPRINLFKVIRLFPREKNVKTYYVGDATPDNTGTFMLMEGSDEPFVLQLPGFRGFVSPRYSTNPDEWRDFTVFNTGIAEIRSVAVDFPGEPYKSCRIDVKEDNIITLIALQSNQVVEKYDTVRMLTFLTSFADIRFEALLTHTLPRNYIDSVLSTQPTIILTLTRKDGQQQSITTYKKKGFSQFYNENGMAMEPVDLDRAYAVVNNGQDFVLIQYFVFDNVLRPLQYFTDQDKNAGTGQ